MMIKINQTAAVLTLITILFVMLNPKESRLWVMTLTMGILGASFATLVVTTLIRIWV